MSGPFAPPPRPPREDGVLPLVNIVFLLLIFFMIAGTIRPPEPLAVRPPQAGIEGEPVARVAVVALAADGRLARNGVETTRAALLAALAAAPPDRLVLRADAATDARAALGLAADIAAAGVGAVDIAVARR